MHIQNVHENQIHSCEKCEYISKNKSELQKHRRKIHSLNKMQCNKCDYETVEAKKLRDHIQSKHENNEYYCENCNFITDVENDFLKHRKTFHNPIEENVFACQYCMSKFTWTGLMKHIKSNHKDLSDIKVLDLLLET